MARGDTLVRSAALARESTFLADAHSGEIRFANAAAGRLLGCPPESLVGRRILDLTVGVDAAEIEPTWKLADRGVLVSFSARRTLAGRDGEVPTLVTACPVRIG